uniref:XK-related protein n=1 Tax=Steinernema glaseri TaxID=37863 RepID=A0A1I7YBS5_9BILA
MAQAVWDRCKVTQTRLRRAANDGFAKLVVFREPKLLYLNEFDPYFTYKSETTAREAGTASNAAQVDIPDKLPTILFVRRRDIFFYFTAIVTYLFDILSDCFIVYYHYVNDRVLAASFVLLFIIFPSALLNILSYLFWSYDKRQKRQRQRTADRQSSQVWSIWLIACILQLGPVRWYAEAIYCGLRFRKISAIDEEADDERLRWFCRMVSAERDAALLRFFEAFLESVPQLVVQGCLAANYFWILHSEQNVHPLPSFLYVQMVSTAISVFSISYSISVQHRTLRMTRPDKQNMELWETAMQILWRYFTVLPRFVCIVLFIICYGYWCVLFLLIHILISLIHIMRLQTIRHKSVPPATECGLVLVNSLIHTFTPFNMTEGSTKCKYALAYSIEAIENLAILYAITGNENFPFPYKCEIAAACIASFILGIAFMALYYGCCHPSRRAPSNAVGRVNDQEDAAIPLDPLPSKSRPIAPLAHIDSTDLDDQS